VFGAGGVEEAVFDGGVGGLGLDGFLEVAFGVDDFESGGEVFGVVSEPTEDDGAGGGVVAVQKDGADEGFEGVFEGGFVFAAFVAFFGFGESDGVLDTETSGEFGEGVASGQAGAGLSQKAFPFFRETMKEVFGQDQVEYGVAQKFEAFIVLGLFLFVFRVRRVSESG